MLRHLWPSLLVSFLAAPAALGNEWKETGVVAAGEAHQAAAADERFVYAIDSKRIAKYDRTTGKLITVSDGDAEHLNSGFFHDGKLLCAHSNYPKRPERSEILALDPASMRLTRFKAFGNYGGSLTWVVRYEGHWWCNFARYGEANGETFLVRFDDEWNETGRWTYPKELLRELGRYSLSGGIWHEGTLLVTGHDDPVIFKLRLPKSGSTLELVGRHPAPFSGQGFAYDPATGGLVGIRRAKRQVVFASWTPDDVPTSSDASPTEVPDDRLR